MTPCPASGAISIANITAAFPNINSNNLNSYAGALWYKSDNSRGYFPSGANKYISMNDFHDTRYITPVVAGSASYSAGTTSITLPALFNTLTVECYGGGGGGGGGSYLAGTTGYSGSDGGNGGSTSFGASTDSFYITASGGTAGAGASVSYASYLYGVLVNNPVGTGANGTDGGYSPDQTNVSSGGTSGKGAADSSSHRLITGPNSYTDYAAANGGSGGKGGKYSKTIFDVGSIGFAAIKYYYNRSIQCSIGYGGGGGGGGGGYDGLKGGAGGNGQIIISWT